MCLFYLCHGLYLSLSLSLAHDITAQQRSFTISVSVAAVDIVFLSSPCSARSWFSHCWLLCFSHRRQGLVRRQHPRLLWTNNNCLPVEVDLLSTATNRAARDLCCCARQTRRQQGLHPLVQQSVLYRQPTLFGRSLALSRRPLLFPPSPRQQKHNHQRKRRTARPGRKDDAEQPSLAVDRAIWPGRG